MLSADWQKEFLPKVRAEFSAKIEQLRAIDGEIFKIKREMFHLANLILLLSEQIGELVEEPLRTDLIRTLEVCKVKRGYKHKKCAEKGARP